MRLLFDQNLSPLLAANLQDIFPESSHIFQIGLDRAVDLEIWEFSRKENFTIVSRDSDFSDLSQVMGFPPKVLWIRRGNCSTHEIEELLRTNLDAVTGLGSNDEAGLLELY